MQRNFVLKPSVHIAYNNFNTQIGSLNNLNRYLYVGSCTSLPSFKESTFNSDILSSTSTTYTTQTLAIAYLQRSCVLSPQVAFGNNQYGRMFHWEIIAGAYLSVVESVGVKFTQDASGDTHQSSSFYAIGTNATIAKFNGKNITAIPFAFSGFKIGFNIGISTGAPKKKVKQIG